VSDSDGNKWIKPVIVDSHDLAKNLLSNVDAVMEQWNNPDNDSVDVREHVMQAPLRLTTRVLPGNRIEVIPLASSQTILIFEPKQARTSREPGWGITTYVLP